VAAMRAAHRARSCCSPIRRCATSTSRPRSCAHRPAHACQCSACRRQPWRRSSSPRRTWVCAPSLSPQLEPCSAGRCQHGWRHTRHQSTCNVLRLPSQ
jgi:hypothetical protein